MNEGAAPAVTNELAGSGMPATGLFGTTWFVQEIGGAGVSDGVTSLFVLHSAGDVAGSGGCNSFSGRVTVNGSAMRFRALATTEMVCTPALTQQEQKFFSALAATRSYGIQGPYLILYDGAGTVLVKLIARSDFDAPHLAAPEPPRPR